MRKSRPYGRNIVLTLCVFAEVIVLNALFVNIVTLFYFYACVNNRHQMNITSLHFVCKGLKLRKFFFAYGKVLVVIHIVNIKVNGVYWHTVAAVALHYRPYLVFVHIAPTALLIAKCPKRCNVAFACKLTHFPYNFNLCVSLYNIQSGVF